MAEKKKVDPKNPAKKEAKKADEKTTDRKTAGFKLHRKTGAHRI